MTRLEAAKIAVAELRPAKKRRGQELVEYMQIHRQADDRLVLPDEEHLTVDMVKMMLRWEDARHDHTDFPHDPHTWWFRWLYLRNREKYFAWWDKHRHKYVRAGYGLLVGAAT